MEEDTASTPDFAKDNSLASADAELHLEQAKRRREPLLFVVDRTGRIVFDSFASTSDEQLVLDFINPGERTIVGRVAEIIQGSILRLETGDEDESCVAYVAPRHLMRLRRLHGPEHLFVVTVEPFRSRDSLAIAARRFSLTRREVETLSLILEGANATEIAVALHITENTVHGYFKRLLVKTHSRNRPAMVANVLQWDRSSSELGSALG